MQRIYRSLLGILLLVSSFLFRSPVHAASVFELKDGIKLILPNEWKETNCPAKNVSSIFCAEILDKTTRIEVSKAEDATFVGALQSHWLFADNSRKPGFSLVIRPTYWKLRGNSEVVAWVYEMAVESRPGHLRKETTVVFCKRNICVRIERGQHDFEEWLPLITQGILPALGKV